MTGLTRRHFTSTAAAALGLGLAGCSGQAISGTRLKLAHTLNSDHPVHKAMEFMGDTLAELSSGSMSVDIYPNGQLGSERQLIELLQIGALAMTKVSAISVEGFSPSMKLFSIPYLFKDKEHYWRVLNSPADLISKKIRVLPSRTAINMIEAMGGAATPMPSGELYTALQQGIVDGAENNPPSYFLSKDFEVAKYYTLDEHTSCGLRQKTWRLPKSSKRGSKLSLQISNPFAMQLRR